MITSTANAQVKQILQWQKKGRARKKDDIFIVEGWRMWKEAPKERIEKVFVSESFLEKRKEEMDLADVRYEIVSDEVFQRMSDTQTPQGILCVLKRKEYTQEEVMEGENPFLMVLDNLQDPGNLGTIVRTAEGAGVTGIFLSADCVDIYNPKTIRSTMGSIYRVPFLYVEDLKGTLLTIKQRGILSYAAHLEGKHFYDEEDYTKGSAFLIGNEGNGLGEEIAKAADVKIRIPMHGQVESLNAAIAASVLMYETCRQRR